MRVVQNLRRHMSYANVTASFALFVAFGGTSYAVLQVDSRDVLDNTLRSKDVRNHTLRGKDVRRGGIGGRAVKERSLGVVPRAFDAERLGGRSAADLTLTCPPDTVATAEMCIESSARPAQGFLTASNICDQQDRGLPTMPQLDAFTGGHGVVSDEGEWTSSVYLEGSPETSTFERLHALLLRGSGVVDHARVNAPNPHPFRCVALPSN